MTTIYFDSAVEAGPGPLGSGSLIVLLADADAWTPTEAMATVLDVDAELVGGGYVRQSLTATVDWLGTRYRALPASVPSIDHDHDGAVWVVVARSGSTDGSRRLVRADLVESPSQPLEPSWPDGILSVTIRTGVEAIVPGPGTSVDDTDPSLPIISIDGPIGATGEVADLLATGQPSGLIAVTDGAGGVSLQPKPSGGGGGGSKLVPAPPISLSGTPTASLDLSGLDPDVGSVMVNLEDVGVDRIDVTMPNPATHDALRLTLLIAAQDDTPYQLRGDIEMGGQKRMTWVTLAVVNSGYGVWWVTTSLADGVVSDLTDLLTSGEDGEVLTSDEGNPTWLPPSGGGGVPDPSSEPDGHVLTTGTGTAEWQAIPPPEIAAADITDATATGVAVITAVDPAAAVDAIGADPAGAGDAAVSSHVSASDPHGDRAYTDTAVAGVHGIPAGGTTGQVLAKTSATDYATGWVPQSGGAPVEAADLLATSAPAGQIVVTDGAGGVDLVAQEGPWVDLGPEPGWATLPGTAPVAVRRVGGLVILRPGGWISTDPESITGEMHLAVIPSGLAPPVTLGAPLLASCTWVLSDGTHQFSVATIALAAGDVVVRAPVNPPPGALGVMLVSQLTWDLP